MNKKSRLATKKHRKNERRLKEKKIAMKTVSELKPKTSK